MAGLITNTEVKTLAILPGSFDKSLIKDSDIIESQKKHLRYILTENLYNDLVINYGNYSALISGTDYVNDSGYNRRYEGLKKCLANYVMFDLLPLIWGQVASAGIYKNNAETATQTTLQEMYEIRGQFLSTAQKEADLIQLYLTENINDYPLYLGFGGSLKDGGYGYNMTGQTRIIGGMIL